jgi:membrane protein insertase Oxa1/YidC/SpoIIIJ
MSTQYTAKTKKETKEPKKEIDPVSPEAILDPEMMQKMMLYMLPVMLAVSSYFFPLGVALYWFIGTLFVIAQQWYVNNKK